MDTAEKRFSMLSLGEDALLFEADGNVDLDDKQHLLGCYSGIPFVIPSTTIDSREKRFSMMGFGDGTHIHVTFEADGAVDADDRAHLLDLYSGIALAGGGAGFVAAQLAAHKFLGQRVVRSRHGSLQRRR